MWFRSILDYLKPAPRRPVATVRRNATRRLIAEALEERCLMTLSPAVGYAMLANPIDAVVGDFNGDGNLDVATINTSQLSVVHGNSDGTFDAAQTTTIGSGFAGLAAADFNGDSRLDLAATSSRWNGTAWQGAVHLLLNNGNDLNGNTTFQAARSFSTGTNTSPAAVVVGDFNGDGKVDVAAAQTGASNVSVLRGNGDGNLQSPLHYTVGYNPGSIAVGDFNNDNKLDLVTANRWGNTVSLLLNNGAAGSVSFQAARHSAIDGNVQSVAVGDFDDNGMLDLVATSNVVASVSWGYYGSYYDYDGQVSVLLGDGAGTFAAPKETWTSYNELGDVTVGDLNSDGILDVVTADGFVQQYLDPTVLLGRGDGEFDAPYYFEAGAGPYVVMVADFNGDTAPDVATANFYASSVSVLMNDANWPSLGAPFVSISNATLTEGNVGAAAGALTISLSAAFNEMITVDYTTSNGTALSGIDYQATSGSVTFEVGETSKTIDVAVLGDRVVEPVEYFFVNLSNPINARMGGGQAIAYIRDDEPLFSIGNATVLEGNTGATEATFTVSLEVAYDLDVTVDFATAAGSADPGSDFEAQSGTLTIPAGETVTTITVLVLGDRVFEQTEYAYYDYYWGYYTVTDASENFQVNLTNPSVGTIANGSGVGTIQDDEPRISISNATVVEGNTGMTEATFTVSLARAYDQDVTLTFATAAGSAASGSDFEAQSDTLTIPAGETAKTITVLVLGDRVFEQSEYTYYDYYGYPYTYFEDNEYFSVNLTSASTGVIVNAAGVGTIQDDDPRFNIAHAYSPAWQDLAYQSEGNTGSKVFTFAVTMSAAYDIPVTVSYNTTDGTATAGSDYQAKSGTLTFNPGEPLTQYIDVIVNGDRLAESHEHFYVNLSNPTSGGVVNGQTYGQILDDEPRISIGDVYKNEGNSGTTQFTFAVYLSAAYDQDVTVNFQTVNGTATSGSDYQFKSGTLTFAPGETVKYITILVTGDTTKEVNETFSVQLTGSSSNASIEDAWGFGYIYNDDTSPGKGNGRKK